MKPLVVFSSLAILACSSGSGPGSAPPPIMTKVVVSNASGVNQTLRVLAVARPTYFGNYGIPFSYQPDRVLRPGDAFVVRYAHDTTHMLTDSIEYLAFTIPPRRDQVMVQVMVNPSTPEPADTVLTIGITPSLMTVNQPSCTDLHFAGLNDLVCKAVTVKLIDLDTVTVAAAISQGHVIVAGNACFVGWAITDTTSDSIEVRNYASPPDAMFFGQSYGTRYVAGQQGPALTEQLDSVSGYAYWTISHTATCP
jgi:hypothetical protein